MKQIVVTRKEKVALLFSLSFLFSQTDENDQRLEGRKIRIGSIGGGKSERERNARELRKR